jgi:hypothetical protein
MSTFTHSADLVRRKLADLEEALELPVVAGELPLWAARAANAAQEVHILLTAYLAQAHREDFAAIAEQDLELAAKIDTMKGEDAAIRRDFDSFWELARNVAKAAVEVEPDELTLEKAQEHMVEKGLRLVLRIRKQEAEVRTWYVEAFTRDRGVGD